ncbi:hypothetical protein CAP35_14940 [Chitinophagaceae bacterium IBVUCB1]|nr:hypothetical protein CAP35_14940 [Chitinophagaceae bacterium IBVUCB1]
MKFNIAWVSVVLIAITSVFTSCQTNKKPVGKNLWFEKKYAIKERFGANTVDTPNAVKKEEVTKEPNNDKVMLMANLAPLLLNEINYKTFSGKAKMHYESNEQKHDLVAHIRINKDNAIWINVTAAAGMVSVARIYITPDSLLLLNHLQKEIHKLAIADANKLLPIPVNFSLLQNLLIGNLLQKGGTPIDATDFGGTWTLSTEDADMYQQIGFNKTDSTIRTMQMRTKDDSTQAMMQYGAYENTNGKQFATERVLTISNKGEPHYLDMNFNKAEFDQPVEMPFNIPKNYKLK